MSPDQDQPTDREADEMLKEMQRIADQWRERLKDPRVQAAIKSGQLRIDPLIKELLELNLGSPPQPKK